MLRLFRRGDFPAAELPAFTAWRAWGRLINKFGRLPAESGSDSFDASVRRVYDEKTEERSRPAGRTELHSERMPEMDSIKIIADSTCDLDPALTRNADLQILPLTITFGSRSYLDGEEITVAQIYDLMRKGVMPQTAQIPYERIYRCFKSCFENGDDFLYIAFSSKMSGCCSLARMVAQELSGEYPGRKFAVIDSRGGSSATGLIVLQALRMVRDGLPFDTIKSEVEFMPEHVEHVFFVDDMKWLVKGGRVSKIVGQMGSVLNIRPVLDVRNGLIKVKQLVRGRKRAVQTVADEIVRRAEVFPKQLIAISHADDRPAAEALRGIVRKDLPGCKTTLCHIGAVLGVHIGLKEIGAFCFNSRPKDYKFV